MAKHEIVNTNPPPEGAAETPPVDPGKRVEAPKADERPEWLDEKFKTPEDMAKAYKELQTKQSQEKPAGEEKPKGEETKTEVPTIEPKTAAEENAFAKYSEEYSEKGELSDEAYKEIADKHGLDRDMVDTYIAGQEARAIKSADAIFDAAGGKENWSAMTEWAAKSMDPAQAEVINAGIRKGGADGVVAANALRAAFEGAGGTIDPNYVTTDGISTTDTTVFESAAQVQAAMSDPLYKTDEAYRQKVAAKLHRSTNLNV